MSANGREPIAEIVRDQARIQAALNRAVHEALRRHKLLGQPIVGWRDGQVVWIPPEEIELNGADHPEPKPPAR